MDQRREIIYQIEDTLNSDILSEDTSNSPIIRRPL